MKLSVRQLSEEFGISHQKLLGALKRSGVATGRDKKVTIKQAYDALTSRSDSKGDMQSERLRKLREEANLLEIERMREERTLVPMAEVQEMVGKYTAPIRSGLLALPVSMSVRCNPTDPELSKKELADWVNVFLRKTTEAFDFSTSDLITS